MLDDLTSTILTSALVLGWASWWLFSQRQLLQHDGEIRRGVRIWSERVPADIQPLLAKLRGSLIYEDIYIRGENGEAVIFSSQMLTPKLLPYVAYINANARRPRIEYRTTLAGVTSIPGLLVFLPLFLNQFIGIPVAYAAGVLTIYFFATLALNHRRERQALLALMQQQARM